MVGLPGSGKTEAFRDFKGPVVDDCSQNVEELGDLLVSDHPVVYVIDPQACTTERSNIEKVCGLFDRSVVVVAYENDPDTCWSNLERRGDNKISKSALYRLSEAYDLSKLQPELTIPVWRP